LSTILGPLEESGDIVEDLLKYDIVSPLIEIGMHVHRDSPVLPPACRWVDAIINGGPERDAPLPDDVETVPAEFRNRRFRHTGLKKGKSCSTSNCSTVMPTNLEYFNKHIAMKRPFVRDQKTDEYLNAFHFTRCAPCSRN
jgi:hypothetical protein